MSNNQELIKNNRNCMEKIDEEYLELLNDIVSYVKLKLAEEESEEAINDILDIFLEAQERGEDLYKVVNGDFKKFSDEFIEAYKYKEKFYFIKKFKLAFIEIMKLIPLYFAFDIITLAPYDAKSIADFSKYSYNITLAPAIFVLVFLILIYAVNYISGMESVVKKKFKLPDYSGRLFISIIGGYLGYTLGGVKIDFMILMSVPNYTVSYSLAIIIMVIYAIKIIKNILNYRKKYLRYIGKRQIDE